MEMDKIVINTAIQTIVSVLSTVFSYFKSYFQEVRIQNSIFCFAPPNSHSF